MFKGYLEFNGNEVENIKELFKNAKNNFTYEFWIKPQQEIKHWLESNKGNTGFSGQKYIIGPGNPGVGRESESGTGISVGNNGIAVYEHSHNNFPALLTYKMTIDDWVHIAVVFENKTPSLYVNGVFKKNGLKSAKNNVFASGIIGGFKPFGYFKGMVNQLRIWNHSKSNNEIKKNMNKVMNGNENGLILNLKYDKPTVIKSDIQYRKKRYSRKSRNNKTFTLPIVRKVDKLELSSKSSQNEVIGKLNSYDQLYFEALNDTNHDKFNDKIFDNLEVDLIIPIYNGFEYTKKCIETVYKNADLPIHLILINDASPDKRVFNYLEKLKTSILPKNLKKLTIIHNKSNLGFVKNVNKGLQLSKNHSVLLNSDTEIPPNCFRRLIYPILINNNISSVTPFSNSATICSFPNFVQDNLLPYNMSVNEIDYYFFNYSLNRGIEIPTGVGFCMALNRNVIDKIGVFDDVAFGKGYGEENDWCMRARNYGYKNILIPNLFVYHKHGGSFNQDSKQELMANNSKKLNQRYPNYSKLVNDFIILDPIKNIRDYIKCIMLAKKNSNREGILFINHNLGGGTSFYQSNYIKTLDDNQRVYTLTPERDHFLLTDHNHDEPINFIIKMDELNEFNFKKLLSALRIDLLFINHLMGYPIEKMISLIRSSLVDYYFVVHDFYSVCPSYNLIDSKGKYCNAETDPRVCQSCINKLFPKQNLIIKEWRNNYHLLLKGAKKVFVPSLSTKEILLKYYNNLRIEVKEHSIDHKVKYTFNERFVNNKNLNIAFVGAIDYTKGSRIIYELRNLIVRQNIPINIKVIGFTETYHKPFVSNGGKFEVTGKYDVESLSDILAEKEISLAVISSICPETYSYTTSELMLSGYPIITSNIGAPAERVKKYNGGWIINNMSSAELLKLLKRLMNDRSEISGKARNLKSYSSS